MSDDDCRLCAMLDENKEILDWDVHKVLWGHSRGFGIMPTKTTKGHTNRFMVVNQMHEADIPEDAKDFAVSFLLRYILKNYNRNYDWAIMEPTHATIPDHWHMVVTTLDPGDDMGLIKDTERIQIHFRNRGQPIVDGATI